MLVGIVVCRNERVSSCGKIHLLLIARALFRGQVPSCRGSLLELFSFRLYSISPRGLRPTRWQTVLYSSSSGELLSILGETLPALRGYLNFAARN